MTAPLTVTHSLFRSALRDLDAEVAADAPDMKHLCSRTDYVEGYRDALVDADEALREVQLPQLPSPRELTLALLVKRLCRRLDDNDQLREGALQYLQQQGLAGSPLRDAFADAAGVVDGPRLLGPEESKP